MLDPFEQISNAIAVRHASKAMQIAQAISGSIIGYDALITKISVLIPQENVPGTRAGLSIEIEYTDLELGHQSDLYKMTMKNIDETLRCAKKEGQLDENFDGSGLVRVEKNKTYVTVAVEHINGSL